MPSRRVFVTATLAGAALSTLPAGSAGQGGTQKTPNRRRVLVFDVNETMLDINALVPHFTRAFGDGQVLRQWFSTLLLYSMSPPLRAPMPISAPSPERLSTWLPRLVASG
jgi:hypothetical protein